MSPSFPHASRVAAPARLATALETSLVAALIAAPPARAHHSFAVLDHLNERWLVVDGSPSPAP